MFVSRNLIVDVTVMLRMLIRSSIRPNTPASTMAYLVLGQLEAAIADHDKTLEK